MIADLRDFALGLLALTAALAWWALFLLLAGCATRTTYEPGKISVIQVESVRTPVGVVGER